MFKNSQDSMGRPFAQVTQACGCGHPQLRFYLSLEGNPAMLLAHLPEEEATLLVRPGNKSNRLIRAAEAWLKALEPSVNVKGVVVEEISSEDDLLIDSSGQTYVAANTETGRVIEVILVGLSVQVQLAQGVISVAGDHSGKENEIRAWVTKHCGANFAQAKIVNPDFDAVQQVKKAIDPKILADLTKLDWTIQVKIAKRIKQGLDAIANPSIFTQRREGPPSGMEQFLQRLSEGGVSVMQQ